MGNNNNALNTNWFYILLRLKIWPMITLMGSFFSYYSLDISHTELPFYLEYPLLFWLFIVNFSIIFVIIDMIYCIKKGLFKELFIYFSWCIICSVVFFLFAFSSGWGN